MRRLLLLIALMAVTVSCTSTATGQPSAAPAEPTAGATASGIVLPPRPRELPIDNVDPCALLTPDQRAELGLDGEPYPSTSTQQLYLGATCTMVGFVPRGVSVGFALVTSNGLDALLQPGLVVDELSATSIADFPAIMYRPPLPGSCSVAVDVAEDQFLDVLFRSAGEVPPIPTDQLCKDAVVVAEQAMQTLITQ